MTRMVLFYNINLALLSSKVATYFSIQGNAPLVALLNRKLCMTTTVPDVVQATKDDGLRWLVYPRVDGYYVE